MILNCDVKSCTKETCHLKESHQKNNVYTLIIILVLLLQIHLAPQAALLYQRSYQVSIQILEIIRSRHKKLTMINFLFEK